MTVWRIRRLIPLTHYEQLVLNDSRIFKRYSNSKPYCYSRFSIKAHTRQASHSYARPKSYESVDSTQQGQRQCRNVLIYGNCKYEGKGCTFYHPPASYQAQEYDQFYSQSQPTALFPLNHHLYNKSTAPYPDLSGTHHGFFVSDDIREDLHRRSENLWSIPPQSTGLPDEVHNYHSLAPLEPTGPDRRKYFGHWATSCYRATSTLDGAVYALRRIENFRLIHESAFSAIEPWRTLSHPNIVRIREAFTTRAFNDSSLVVTYDYHPLATTLFDTFLIPKPVPPYQSRGLAPAVEPIPEETIWSFVIQISNAMKAVHDRGLAFRVMDATKILLTGKSRLRINCCGLADLVNPDIHDVASHQQEDMISFGRLILSLCSRSADISNYAKIRDIVSRSYSTDLQNAIMFLISPHGSQKIIGKLFDFIGSRLLLEMDAVQLRADALESQLARELENGRLVRLLSKFGFINERPEFARDYRWSETGDKYIVKLFRDHVFHGVDENGRPVVSLSHVLTNLNKLDAGSEEKLMLISRDDQSCLVVSYREIKRCVESAFR
ncbi:hypothetical protein M408DRAFT_15958 [Serendipita vermifera MAFF 305830]|uniref:PAN2-PAN3 deadenylation complex subunit PAN3 n=1 Tax=Serendipita vermifera MAFF 305830 TaxID=933852 RepID=A0A0C2XJI6_SERVB|nr:hypothetical protein M408DRAFT_15958 [Serendipita vermifera MAFF 305830]